MPTSRLVLCTLAAPISLRLALTAVAVLGCVGLTTLAKPGRRP